MTSTAPAVTNAYTMPVEPDLQFTGYTGESESGVVCYQKVGVFIRVNLLNIAPVFK